MTEHERSKARPDKPTDTPASAETRPRKPYRRPALTEYGSIGQLTRSGGSTRKESGVPNRRER